MNLRPGLFIRENINENRLVLFAIYLNENKKYNSSFKTCINGSRICCLHQRVILFPAHRPIHEILGPKILVKNHSHILIPWHYEYIESMYFDLSSLSPPSTMVFS